MEIKLDTANYANYIKNLTQTAADSKESKSNDNNVLDDLEKAIEFINSKKETTTNKVLLKYDLDNDGKVTKEELSFSLDANGDGKLDANDTALAAKRKDNSRQVITNDDGSVSIYQFGLLQKKIFSDGKYRLYQRDSKGSLTSSVTFRKDGTKYSQMQKPVEFSSI